jgi:hypothetical protein
LNNLSPIILFAYNRPWHTEHTLLALKNNIFASDSTLYIYADGVKIEASKEDKGKITETRKIIRKQQWCKEVKIIESDINKGLANSIIEGVTEIINIYGKAIILEDDIVTSIGFLKYMNEALNLYEDNERVMHISGYMFPIKNVLPDTFFYNTASCWGWATWKRSWLNFEPNPNKIYSYLESNNLFKKFNIDNQINFSDDLLDNCLGKRKTWAIKWYGSIFMKNGFCLHPYPSLCQNIGMDNSGENCVESNYYRWETLTDFIVVKPIVLKESKIALRSIKKFYKPKLIHKYGPFLGKITPVWLKSLVKFIIKNYLYK